MTTEDLATGGEQPVTTASTAAPEKSDKVETKANEEQKTSEASTEAGKQPDPIADPAKEAEAASEAAKALQKRKQTMQDRLNDVTHARREAERRAERAERDLAQLRSKMKAPVADEYTDPAKLTADQVNHTLDQREAQRLEAERTEAAKDADKARAVAWHERVQEFKADNADFEQVAFSAHIGPETSLMVADMEEGPAVAYHLGKNPALASQIEGLPERQRPFALGKLAAQITAPPPRRVTSAPPPVDAASGKSGGGRAENPADMSVERYVEWRKNGGGGGKR